MARLIYIIYIIFMKEFQNTREMVAYIKRNMAANEWIPFDRFLREMWERGDTVWWLSIPDIVNWKEWWYEDIKQACEIPQSSIDFSKYDEDIFSANEPGENDMSFSELSNNKDWNKKTNWQKINSVVDKYEAILNDIKKLVDDNNSGQWLSDEALSEYKQNFADKVQELKDIEESKAFSDLMELVAERGTWKILWDYWIASPRVNRILDYIANWYWDKIFSEEDRINNILAWATNTRFDNFWYAWRNMARDPKDIANEFLAKKWNKKWWDKNKNKLWDLWTWYDQDSDTETFWYKKRPKMANKEVADEMSFGDDVAWKWWQDYIDERNKTLALHLKLRGLETPEQIDAYLNQYPNWENAKQEWKDNTTKVLSEQISKMTAKRDVEKTAKENKEKQIKEAIDEIKNSRFQDQNPENNSYLAIDEEVKNLDNDRSRVQYLVDKWFRMNDEWYWEKDGIKTKVYKDWIYDNDLKNMSTASKNDINLQELWYDWPRNEKWHFRPKTEEDLIKEQEEKKKQEEEKVDPESPINDVNPNNEEEKKFDLDMNEDILNWTWDVNEHWSAGPKPKPIKQKTTLKKSSKNTDKKEDKKDDKKKTVTMKDIIKVVKSSPTIKNLLKTDKK